MTGKAEMSHEEVRQVLLAKIEAAWPAYKDNPKLARRVELGSNSDLRRHLAWAEAMAEALATPAPDEPEPLTEPSPRVPAQQAEMMRRILRTRTGNELSPHLYVTASSECSWYKGPAWVPFNLWQAAEYGGNSSLEQECANKLINSTGAEALWGAIAKRYARPDSVSTNLAVVCADALASWRVMPRDTPSDFKEGREKLARRAEQLALELERFFLPRDADKHEWSGLLDFTHLLTEAERDHLDFGIRRTTIEIVNRARENLGVRALDWEEYNDISSEARGLGYQNERPYQHDFVDNPARVDAYGVYNLLQPDHTRPDLPYGGVPTLPNLLRRIADKFREDGDFPPLTRPNLANAERNFFTRFICKYFWTSRGDVSPAIVRDIVSIFYEQGIGENDVSQVAAQVKRDHPLQLDPEDSRPN